MNTRQPDSGRRGWFLLPDTNESYRLCPLTLSQGPRPGSFLRSGSRNGLCGVLIRLVEGVRGEGPDPGVPLTPSPFLTPVLQHPNQPRFPWRTKLRGTLERPERGRQWSRVEGRRFSKIFHGSLLGEEEGRTPLNEETNVSSRGPHPGRVLDLGFFIGYPRQGLRRPP